MTPSEPPGAGAYPSRRGVLRLGLGLSLLSAGLSACSTSPVIERSGPGAGSTATQTRPAPGPATPGPPPTAPVAATFEQQLSDYAAAVLRGPHRAKLTQRDAKLLGFVRDAHAQHAVALAGSDPTTRPSTAAPAPRAAAPTLGPSLKASLRALARAESAQAKRQREAALAGRGLTALLSGSLCVTAASFAQALTADQAPPVHAIGTHRPGVLVSDVVAMQAAVSQLNAMVYGYQLALGKLSVGSSARSRAYTELTAQRSRRDELIAILIRRSADVPPVAAGYAPSPNPRTAADAGRLIQQMHTRFQPYAGVLLAAAATRSDRSLALSLLAETTTIARGWGAPLRAWPGWPD